MDLEIDETQLSLEEGVNNLPDLDLPRVAHLLRFTQEADDGTTRSQFLDRLQQNYMLPYYQLICEEWSIDVDEHWVNETTEYISNKLEELDSAIVDAVQNLGETEVRLCNLAKANFLCSIGDKKRAETAYVKTNNLTVGSGHKLDVVFTLIRMGFFFNDYDLIKRNIEKAKFMIEEGGDWDRKNRLKVYEAYYFLTIREFIKASELFLDSLATFTSYELFSYEENVYYTVLSALYSLPRVELKEKIVDSPEIKTVIHHNEPLKNLLDNFYNCNYAEFFHALGNITDELGNHRFLYHHASYFCRELRIKAYAQFLESYLSVQLSSVAEAFGVTEDFIDSELSRFISLGRIPCAIDKVAMVIHTKRSESKNSQYHETIKQGDILLNRVQKLSRVIHL
eukprot:TRINITY_DN11800_c0_g1_i1.p1 TRINITY_DN11800_c0_g1~~TRINITY_DN11800_c0_g1_i1.p1  ORF type:complete len:416 (+),score=79.22 TRINITY_DN11800_c0_g1_i1:64-1248(+)